MWTVTGPGRGKVGGQIGREVIVTLALLELPEPALLPETLDEGTAAACT